MIAHLLLAPAIGSIDRHPVMGALTVNAAKVSSISLTGCQPAHVVRPRTPVSAPSDPHRSNDLERL
jgi:hypothetical protein